MSNSNIKLNGTQSNSESNLSDNINILAFKKNKSTKSNKSEKKISNIEIEEDVKPDVKQEVKPDVKQEIKQESEVVSNISNSYDISDLITIKDFKAKELMHYKKLDNFFSNCTKEENQLMVDIINGTHLISLRFLDWFVTRYCFLYKLSIGVENRHSKQNDFNINISYKAQLKSFKKKYFDPFRRKKKFYYVCEKNNLVLLTTLGQLNFFRWAISYDIIKYTETNYRVIITKVNHVNKYFKKNLLENGSYGTSDENADNSKTNSDSKSSPDTKLNSDSKTNSDFKSVSDNKSNSDLKSDSTSLNDINSSQNSQSDDLLTINNTGGDIKIRIKDYKKLKDNKAKYKNPVVSRNIFLEL